MATLTLRELFNAAAKSAAQLFAESGEVLPMMHAVRQDGKHILIPLVWETKQDKLDVMRQLKTALPAFGVRRYAVIAEAWMVTERTVPDALDALNSVESLKDHPDRREALTISAADKNGQRLAGQFYILRPEHGPPKLSPLHLYDEVVGDFFDLLEA